MQSEDDKQVEKYNNGETDRELSEADIRIARKFSVGSMDLLEQARSALAVAMEAYSAGDPLLARVFLDEAQQLADIRADLPLDPGLEEDDELSIQLSVADGLVAACDSVLPLFQPDKLFQLTDDTLKKSFVFKKTGSFNLAGKQKNTNSLMRSIFFYFWLDKKIECKDYCIVSVFCFMKKSKDGKRREILKPAANGFTEFYKEFYGRVDKAGDKKKKSALPHNGKDVGGYAVDTPFYLPDTPGNPAVKCPCYTAQERIDDVGKKDKDGKNIFAEDRPGAKLFGLIEYFETAVLCLDKKPYVVLNSMRWRVRDSGIEIMNKKGKFITPGERGKTNLKGEEIDQGDVSDAFKRALLDWIAKMTKEHEIKDIECGKGKKSDKKKSDDKKKKKKKG